MKQQIELAESMGAKAPQELMLVGKQVFYFERYVKELAPDYVMYNDRNNNLWVGTEGDGVCKIDIKPKKFNVFPVNKDEYPELTRYFIKSLSEDTGGRTWFDVDVGAETLDVTTAKQWPVGARLNLERALKIGDELGGHIVAGHVDGIATVVARDDLHGMARFELRTARDLARFIAAKGSVTLDGVSLTVNAVRDETFSVLIIPRTLDVTTLGGWHAGREVNIEVDLMARYAARLNEMK